MSVQLRILRYNHRWERIPGQEVRFGGPPPELELVYDEKLQYRGHTDWFDVPVVIEEEIPEDPREVKRRQEREERRLHMEGMNVDIRKQMRKATGKARKEHGTKRIS